MQQRGAQHFTADIYSSISSAPRTKTPQSQIAEESPQPILYVKCVYLSSMIDCRYELNIYK